MIPPEKSAAVTEALREAFGTTELENVRMIKGLASSFVFRTVVRGSPYLLKICMRTSDPARHYACMKAAAEAGLAPRVWYTSTEDRISITDFVETAPFPLRDALVQIPTVLRTLHALPAFPKVPGHINTSCMFLINKGPAVEAFIQSFQAANILPKQEGDELQSLLAQIAAVYPYGDADMVSSHNDLFKPDNILFDAHRVWLVDWEAAFLNDRYADLAVVANLVATSDEEEIAYLTAYFGEPPDQYQLARLFLARQLTHIFYAMAYLLQASRKSMDSSDSAAEFGEFHRRLWAGEIDLADDQIKGVYGRVHLNQLFRNTRQSWFSEVLAIVSDRKRRA